MNGSEEQKNDNGNQKSALEHNIKTKGEYSYYYAHGKKYEQSNSEQKGIVIEGPGIITGGEPILLDKRVKEVDNTKVTIKFTKYIFYDDDKNVKIKIDLPESIKDITSDCLIPEFSERSLNVKLLAPADTYLLDIKKLNQKIVPKDSSAVIVKGKIIITLRKKNDEEEWDKLNA